MKTDIYDHFCRRCVHVREDIPGQIVCALVNAPPDLSLGCLKLEIDPERQKRYETRHLRRRKEAAGPGEDRGS